MQSETMLHNHLLGSSTEINPITEAIDTDVGSILRRLLLFDKYTLDSLRLLEIPAIVRCLGIDGTIALLRSGSLKLYIAALSIAQVGHATILKSRVKKGVLSKGKYSFQIVEPHNRREYIEGCFRKAIDPIPIPLKKKILLKKVILDAIEQVPIDVGRNTLIQLHTDLRNGNPALFTSVHNQLKKKFGEEINVSQLYVRLEPLDEEDYETNSNLEELFGLNLDDRHRIVERAALDLAGVNKRLAEMFALNAISGFRIGDLPIFEQKTAFLFNSIDPTKQENRASRLFEIAKLPDFRDVGKNYKIDVTKFLEVRNSKECREFRSWLPSIDTTNEKEIKKTVQNFRAHIASILNSPTGRTLRFLTQEAIGLISGAGIVLGPAAGALDTFVVDRIFKESSIVTFVSKQYPALFEDLEK
jgi:hypothetical protein